MPFTFSHPAIVLPFGKWFCLSALIVGSMIPDFEYFMRMKIHSQYSHTLLGVLWFDLPLGLMVLFVFHLVVKKPLIENLPGFAQKRLSRLKKDEWMRYFKANWKLVVISILLGAYSHLFWDAFTHKDAFFVKLFELNGFIGDTKIPISKFLQHFSTFFGAFIIALYFFKLSADDIEYVKPRISFWLKVIFITCLILVVRIQIGLNPAQYGHLTASIIGVGMLSLSAVCLLEKLRQIKTCL